MRKERGKRSRRRYYRPLVFFFGVGLPEINDGHVYVVLFKDRLYAVVPVGVAFSVFEHGRDFVTELGDARKRRSRGKLCLQP